MNSRNPVLTTAIACAAMALAAFTLALALGHPRAGLALGAGLLIGGANGFLVRRALGFAAGFRATSLGRLVLLSVTGLAVGLLLGLDVFWWSLVGIAIAQLALAAAAARELVRS